MKQGDLTSGAGKLYHVLKELRQKWSAAREQWDDHARNEFEKNYIIPLDPKLVQCLEGMARLQQVMIRAQQECS